MPDINLAAVGPLSDLWWPEAMPGTDRVYTFDLADIAQIDDAPVSASLRIAPSGDDEMEAVDLSVNSYQLSAQLAGGQPGREYRNLITVIGASGRHYQYLIRIMVSAASDTPPPGPPPPPDPGFGDPISWTNGGTVYGPAVAAVEAGLIGTGTNQATALLLPAQTNIIASVPSGTGFRLRDDVASGTFVIQNDDPVENAPIYPPEGARINALDIDAPFILGSFGARLNFSTQDAATQWYAG